MKRKDEVREEYDFSQGVRGKYAAQARQGTNVVLLDPDVAAVFHDPKVVNAVLRSLIPLVRESPEPK
jgi:hypothetical protein